MTGVEEKSSYIGNFQVELGLQWISSEFRRNARMGQEWTKKKGKKSP